MWIVLTIGAHHIREGRRQGRRGTDPPLDVVVHRHHRLHDAFQDQAVTVTISIPIARDLTLDPGPRGEAHRRDGGGAIRGHIHDLHQEVHHLLEGVEIVHPSHRRRVEVEEWDGEGEVQVIAAMIATAEEVEAEVVTDVAVDVIESRVCFYSISINDVAMR